MERTTVYSVQVTLCLYEDTEGNVYKRLILQCYSYKLNIVDFFFCGCFSSHFSKNKTEKKKLFMSAENRLAATATPAPN